MVCWTYVANASAGSTETIGTIGTLNSGASSIILNPNGKSAVLTTTLGAAVNGATIYLQGSNMTATSGVYTNLVAATWNQTLGQGGTSGVTMPIRADMVGVDTAVSSLPTFITKASTSTNYLRPLIAATEMTSLSTTAFMGSNAAGAANSNILLPTGATTLTAFPSNNTYNYINSLTLAGGATLNQPAFWFFPTSVTNYAYDTLVLNSGGILVQPGAAATINLGQWRNHRPVVQQRPQLGQPAYLCGLGPVGLLPLVDPVPDQGGQRQSDDQLSAVLRRRHGHQRRLRNVGQPGGHQQHDEQSVVHGAGHGLVQRSMTCGSTPARWTS